MGPSARKGPARWRGRRGTEALHAEESWGLRGNETEFFRSKANSESGRLVPERKAPPKRGKGGAGGWVMPARFANSGCGGWVRATARPAGAPDARSTPARAPAPPPPAPAPPPTPHRE